MQKLLPFLSVVFVPLGSVHPAEPLPPAARHQIDFVKEIKPLLEASCVKCHAKGKNKGGFSLETREAFLRGGDTGAVVVRGKSAESHVIAMVAGVDPDEMMPKKGTKWTSDQVGLLRAWIDQGMSWDPAITFAKPPPRNLHPHVVQLPPGVDAHPVDRLVASYFQTHKVSPPERVDDRIFARRIWLDTIGLPPSPAQLGEFLADSQADKREKLIRRLLDDRRGYADHWLTFWNDLLRNDYKGTGFIDGGRKQITRWLYSALLTNLPYDQFVAQLVSPGKLSDGFTKGIIWRGEVNASMQPPMQAAQNISQVFMGVNLKCASCHDSFINDWALADAYGLAAVYSEKPLELVHCDKPTGQRATMRFLYPSLGALAENAPPAARVQRLAEILTGRENGRLARTMVNRLWARLLGRGLVEPLDDMEQPAWHADLLDWLAEDLVAHGYDLKHTLEVIFTSRAYQLPAVERGSENEPFVFRGPWFRRLTAEQFLDVVFSIGNSWKRLPASLEFDFSALGSQPEKLPDWIWTDEPVEAGPRREALREARRQLDAATRKLAEAQKNVADLAADDPAAMGHAQAALERANEAIKAAQNGMLDASRPPAPGAAGSSRVIPEAERHRVIFRQKFTLPANVVRAYAAVLATQRFDVKLNGKEAKSVMRDNARNGRVALFDMKDLLAVGENIVTIDVSSHTEKQMNDTERKNFPASATHVNARSGLAFYLRCELSDNQGVIDLGTDGTWHVRRNPDGAWATKGFDDKGWRNAVVLPAQIEPVDEGPGLEPITRRDFANEPVELGGQLRPAISITVHAGKMRAAHLAADPLQTALDRPNREQIVPVRANAATTLQALELTNGATLDAHIKDTANANLEEAAKAPAEWLTKVYLSVLGRAPSEKERDLGLEMLGNAVSREGAADLLWALLNLPEFQLIN